MPRRKEPLTLAALKDENLWQLSFGGFSHKVSHAVLGELAGLYIDLTDRGHKPLYFAIQVSGGKLKKHRQDLEAFQPEKLLVFDILVDLCANLAWNKTLHLDCVEKFSEHLRDHPVEC